MIPTARLIRAGLVVLLAASLVACSPIYRSHGYAPTEEELAQITPGVDTRDGVVETLGEPTVNGVIRDGDFYYVKSRFRIIGPREPREIDRQVVVIRFDEAGVVTGVERYGLEDGRVVALSRRVTTTGQTNIDFLRQLFGNFGRFTAEDLLQNR